MPPIPALPTVSEPGQTRLSFNGPGITLKKLGKPAKPVYKVPPHVARRWLSGSAYKNGLAQQFKVVGNVVAQRKMNTLRINYIYSNITAEFRGTVVPYIASVLQAGSSP
jgi:hypothetical protein